MKVEIYSIIKTTAGKNHYWVNSSVGVIRKPISVVKKMLSLQKEIIQNLLSTQEEPIENKKTKNFIQKILSYIWKVIKGIFQ